jgi:hypothetical protein
MTLLVTNFLAFIACSTNEERVIRSVCIIILSSAVLHLRQPRYIRSNHSGKPIDHHHHEVSIASTKHQHQPYNLD